MRTGAVFGMLLALAWPRAAQAGAHQYVLAFQTPEQATILDLASRTQREVTLSFNVALLRKTPAHLSDMDVYWGDGVLQIECLDHHTRLMLTAGYTLDRTRRFDEPSPAFHPWSDNVDGSQARTLENYVCHGQGAASFAPIGDLTGFVRSFVGGQALAAATPPAPAASAPSSAGGASIAGLGTPGAHPPPQGLARYEALSADADGAMLIDMTSTQRQGQVVSLTEYDLFTKPFLVDRREVQWIEAVTQFDCAGHRARSGTRAWLTLDAKSRVVAQDQTFNAWDKVKADTPGAAGEALLCHGKVTDPDMLASDDLDQFQQEVFLAIAHRAKK